MSKFIDMLSRSGEQAPAPMGFGLRKNDQRPARALAIAGFVAPSALPKAKAAAGTVDAVLLASTGKDLKALDKAASRLDDELWGVRSGAVSAEQARHVAGLGCDFMVFDAEDTSAAILDIEDLGKVITVGSDLDDEEARSIAWIPIDAVLYTPGELEFPLSVEALLAISRVRSLLDFPFLMAVSGAMSGDDLGALRNAGIAGLVMDLAARDDITRTASAIDGLPRRKPRPIRGNALVPRMAAVDTPDYDDDYPDEDEDF